MQRTNWKDIAELVGITAIVASLIFVGLEMRQTRALAMAETYQSRTDSEMFLFSYMSQPELRRIWLKTFDDEALTDDDEVLLVFSFGMRLAYLENLHFQMENGMLSRELWIRNLRSLTPFFVAPRVVEWWELNRDIWRSSFSRDIDGFIESIDRDDQRTD